MLGRHETRTYSSTCQSRVIMPPCYYWFSSHFPQEIDGNCIRSSASEYVTCSVAAHAPKVLELFTMEVHFAVFVQLVLSVPFCLQFWFSYLKLQRKEVVQVVTKSSGGIPFPAVTICRKGNPNVILNEWYVHPQQACKLKFRLSELIFCFCCIQTSNPASQSSKPRQQQNISRKWALSN